MTHLKRQKLISSTQVRGYNTQFLLYPRLKRRVSAQGWSFWGLKRWVTIFGENMPQNSPKMGVNRQFQAKLAKI